MSPESEEIMSNIEAIAVLRNLGWNMPDDSEAWEEDGYIFFRVGDEDDCTGYLCQVNPETGASRHCGNGEGCFWTDWEGGDYDEDEDGEY